MRAVFLDLWFAICERREVDERWLIYARDLLRMVVLYKPIYRHDQLRLYLRTSTTARFSGRPTSYVSNILPIQSLALSLTTDTLAYRTWIPWILSPCQSSLNRSTYQVPTQRYKWTSMCHTDTRSTPILIKMWLPAMAMSIKQFEECCRQLRPSVNNELGL